MLKFSMDLLSLRWNKRARGVSVIKMVLFLRTFLRPKSNPIAIDFNQLRKINSLPISKASTSLDDTRALFVVTEKDFVTLPTAIKFLIKSTGLASNQVDIVTPERYLQKCAKLLASNFSESPTVIGEGAVLTIDSLGPLKSVAGNRFGWVYQQLLKVQSSLSSTANFTLVCDADTFLLRNRNWVNGISSALTPSFESNDQYYSFLNRAFDISAKPEFSFVSHHMLINNKKMREIFKLNQLESVHDLVSKICEHADFNEASMVSVDYEFYAQTMHRNFPNEIHLEKWSNIGLPAKYFKFFNKFSVVRKVLTFNFQSVSFHSWS
jgi:hypothetical protein